MLLETIDLKIDYKKAGINVSGINPTLTSYTILPSKEMHTKKFPAIIICPGGGYDFLSDRENEPVALRYAGNGIQAFVLRYSCVKKPFPCAVLEIAEAIRYLRKNADRYDIDKDKIIVCGFSAGGHLAASIANMYHEDFILKALDATEEDIKPNGCVLGYPVITSDEKYTHESTIQNLLADSKEPEKLRKYVSLEKRVTEKTPKTFLWHTADDGAVPVENSLYYMEALSKNKVIFEAHIYEYGGHGLSLCNYQTSMGDYHIMPVNEKWVDASIDWIKRLN